MWTVGPHKPQFLKNLLERLDYLVGIVDTPKLDRRAQYILRYELDDVLQLLAAIAQLKHHPNPLEMLTRSPRKIRGMNNVHFIARGRWFAYFDVDLNAKSVVGFSAVYQ